MTETFISGQGDFFVQTDRGEPFEYLTCVSLTDVPRPRGDVTAFYEPDPAQKGQFRIAGFIQGEPGAGTLTLERPLSSVYNFLLEQECEFEGMVAYSCRGQRGNPENYDVAFVLYRMRITQDALQNVVASQPGDQDRVNTNAEVSYRDVKIIYRLTVARQSLSSTAAANAIAFLPKECQDPCGNAPRGLCKEGYLALDGEQYNSLVMYTRDGGANWNETSSDPFTYGGGDAGSIITVTTSSGHRAIVARKSATAGEPAEVAITTDWGANWTNVDVGSVSGQYINKLFYYAGYIWAACSGGYIYRSSDLGDTWEAQESGVETTEDLNDIVMYTEKVGYAVGDNNAFLYTTDGEEWNSRTGPAAGVNLLSVAVNDLGHVFVGAANGNLYVSEDGGETWETRKEFGSGSVDRIVFEPDLRYFGFVVYNNAAGRGYVYRSKDGGATWIAPDGQPSNGGLNDVWPCDQNTFFACGEVYGGTTVVLKGNPSS